MSSPEFRYQFESAETIQQDRSALQTIIIKRQGIFVNSHFPYTIGLAARDLDNRLMGIAEVNIHGNKGEFAFMVHPDHQNQGIGKDLLERMIFACLEKDLTELTATATPHSVSERILKSRGFKEVDPGWQIKRILASPRTFLRLELPKKDKSPK